MSDKQREQDRERFQILINTAVADVDEIVQRVLKDGDYPNEALDARVLEESVEGRGQLLATVRLPPRNRREQLLRLVGETILLLALDEQRRGDDAIEEEMNAFFDGESKKEAS